MNKVILTGRLTRDPDVKLSANNSTLIARFTLAVDRKGKKNEADFISCIAFGKSAEFYEKYVAKGMKMAITGRIQTGSYTNKDGKKVYTTDVIVEESEFGESKKAAQEHANGQDDNSVPMEIPDVLEEELPFS